MNGKKSKKGSGNRIACEYCHKTLASTWGLDAHIKTVHGQKCFNCEYCDKAFARKDHLDNHVKSIHTGLKKCTQCNETFKGRDGLAKHVEEFHPYMASLPRQPGTFHCQICNKTFISKYRLRQHCQNIHNVILPRTPRTPTKRENGNSSTNHTPNKLAVGASLNSPKNASTIRVTKCPLCSEIVGTTAKLIKHMTLKHGGSNKTFEIVYSCQYCSGTFTNESALEGHIKCFHAEQTCLICGNVFVGSDSTAQHIKESHLPKKILNSANVLVFQCDACGSTFEDKSLYNDHVFNSHTWSRYNNKAKMNLGDSMDSASMDLRATIAAAAQGQAILHSCEVCGQIFANENHLDEHVQETHPFHETFQCEICEAIFDDEGLLDEHIGEFHHPPSDMDEEEIMDDKGFKSGQLVTIQEQQQQPLVQVQTPVVTDESIVKSVTMNGSDLDFGSLFNQCDLCHQLFNEESELKAHLEKNHSSEEVFKCQECNDVYANAAALERHLSAVHPIIDDQSEGLLQVFYQCHLCEELLDDQDSLNKHTCNSTSTSSVSSSFINSNGHHSSSDQELITETSDIISGIELKLNGHSNGVMAELMTPVAPKLIDFKDNIIDNMKEKLKMSIVESQPPTISQ